MSWLVTPALVASWYATNIGVVLMNKFLLSFYGFKFPILLTLLHMVACTLFSLATIASGWVPLQHIQTRTQFFKVCVLSLIFTVTIILGNVSLRFIPVSFNQAIGATTPFFTAILSLLVQGKQESYLTYLALIPVVLGIVVATGFEPSFHLIGFAVCLLATGLRAFKTVIQAVLLSDPSEKLNSFNLLLYMAPLAVVGLIPTTMVLEPESVFIAQKLLVTKPAFIHLLALNCGLAFCANLLNFLITKHTSALTLQVLGNVKGVVATVVSVLLFQNSMTVLGCVGYAASIAGCVAYGHSARVNPPLEPKLTKLPS